MVIILAFGARGHWVESCLDLINISAMHLFMCFFITDSVYKTNHEAMLESLGHNGGFHVFQLGATSDFYFFLCVCVVTASKGFPNNDLIKLCLSTQSFTVFDLLKFNKVLFQTLTVDAGDVGYKVSIRSNTQSFLAQSYFNQSTPSYLSSRMVFS